MLVEAQGFYESARYDLAYKRYDQVLDLDPGNAVARDGQTKVNQARERYANEAYNETRVITSWNVTKQWETAPRKYVNREIVRMESSPINPRNTEYIENKLNHIIIPTLEFHEATIRDALEFLQKRSVELDMTEPDPSRRGINIVMKLEPVQQGGGSNRRSGPGRQK